MIYTADYLISKRKEKWNEHQDIEKDKELREAIAEEIATNKSLLNELKEYPEKLIELVFVVVDKNQKTIPFFLNDVQKEFAEILNKAKKDFNEGKITDINLLILKGRQQGFTTLVTAYQLASSILKKNFQGFTLSDESGNSETIFENKAKFPYSMIPELLKPTEKFNNKKQLLFNKINSSWQVDTATKNVGRSRTINFFHGSECAFWNCGISYVQSALGEAFTKNCIKIWESTANGFNDYQKMWKSGVYINCFFEWWKTPEYRTEFYSEEDKQEFSKNINKKTDWIYERLQWLQKTKKLELEQLYWYYKKYESYIDKNLIKQEYPCTPEEAFISSGNCVFNVDIIQQRLDEVEKPIRVGYFTYDYDDTRPAYRKGLQQISKISNIKWVNDINGYIRIYEIPGARELGNYGIGGDTAGEGSDFFTAHVINPKTLKQVAVLEKQFDADEYARQVYCLGMYYKNAMVGIENNFDSFPIKELERLGYTNMYVEMKEDSSNHKLVKRYGFRTDVRTRPMIIDYLKQLVKECPEVITDENTLKQMLEFIVTDKGRAEAQEGSHDDLVMGLAIAYHIAKSVPQDRSKILMHQDTFFKEDTRREKGDKVIVV